MFAIVRRRAMIMALSAAALFALSACERVAEQRSVDISQNPIPLPEILTSEFAGQLFSNGKVFAVLNIYDSSSSSTVPVDTLPRRYITSSSTKVEWDNVPVSGDLSRYLFEVVWKSNLYPSLDGDQEGGIAISRSTPAPLDANNNLVVTSYDNAVDSNGDGTSNIDAMLLNNEDPLVCVIDASLIDACRLL